MIRSARQGTDILTSSALYRDTAQHCTAFTASSSFLNTRPCVHYLALALVVALAHLPFLNSPFPYLPNSHKAALTPLIQRHLSSTTANQIPPSSGLPIRFGSQPKFRVSTGTCVQENLHSRRGTADPCCELHTQHSTAKSANFDSSVGCSQRQRGMSGQVPTLHTPCTPIRYW